MVRDDAVARINDGLGFRQTGWARTQTVQNRLMEAQRNLERGKTLPKFLIQQDATITLSAGQHTTAYPPGFLRISDDTRLRYYPDSSEIPLFLSARLYIDAVESNLHTVLTPEDTQVTFGPTAPKIYVFRPTDIDFVTTADIDYTLFLDYYMKAAILSTNIENAWLADDAGAEWLIGEAGYRMAMDLRDETGKAIFNEMRTSGRAALFGDDLAWETQSQPMRMGANQ